MKITLGNVLTMMDSMGNVWSNQDLVRYQVMYLFLSSVILIKIQIETQIITTVFNNKNVGRLMNRDVSKIEEDPGAFGDQYDSENGFVYVLLDRGLICPLLTHCSS